MELKVITEKDGTIRLTLGVSAVQFPRHEDAVVVIDMLQKAVAASKQARQTYPYSNTLLFPDITEAK